MATSSSMSRTTIYGPHQDDEHGIYYTVKRNRGEEHLLPHNDIICVQPSHPKKIFYTRRSSSSEESESTNTFCHTLTLDQHFPKGVLDRLYAKAGSLDYFTSTLSPTQIFIYVSTRAGSHNAPALSQHLVLPFLASFGITPMPNSENYETSTNATIVTSSDPGLLSHHFIHNTAFTTFLPHAQAGRRTLLILLTGDGGIADTLETVYSITPTSIYQPPVIALIPAGTGNALANSCNILRDNTHGLRTLMLGSRKPLPVMSVSLPEGSYLLDSEGGMSAADRAVLQSAGAVPGRTVHAAVVFSWALHSTLVADSDTPTYRQYGAERFKMAAGALLAPEDGSGPHAFGGKLSYKRAGEEEWTSVQKEEHAYLVCTLVRELEKGFTISPRSRAADGRMWVVHFGPLEGGGEGVMEVMGKAYGGGKHVGDERVGYEEIVGLRVEVMEEEERWRRVCVDGKIFVVPQGGVVEVRKPQGRSLLDLMMLDE